jgi:hypothetical protein
MSDRPEQRVLEDIDGLIRDQLEAGEPETGYDYGDPDYPGCPHSWCSDLWHGLPIEIEGPGGVVLCPGSAFRGEFTPPVSEPYGRGRRVQGRFIEGGVRVQPYPSGMQAILDGDIDWVADDIKVMLCTRAYLRDGRHHYRSDISHEVDGPGYQAGGIEMSGRTRHIDRVELALHASDALWDSVTIHPHRAIVYKDTGDPETSQLICCVSFDLPRPVVCGTLRFRWPPEGVVRISTALM